MTAMDRKTGRALQGLEEVEQSINEILGTEPGKRVMQWTFGSGVYELVDGPVDASGAARLAGVVNDDLRKWEPRVRVDRVTRTVTQAGVATIDVFGKVRQSGEAVRVRR